MIWFCSEPRVHDPSQPAQGSGVYLLTCHLFIYTQANDKTAFMCTPAAKVNYVCKEGVCRSCTSASGRRERR